MVGAWSFTKDEASVSVVRLDMNEDWQWTDRFSSSSVPRFESVVTCGITCFLGLER